MHNFTCCMEPIRVFCVRVCTVCSFLNSFLLKSSKSGEINKINKQICGVTKHLRDFSAAMFFSLNLSGSLIFFKTLSGYGSKIGILRHLHLDLFTVSVFCFKAPKSTQTSTLLRSDFWVAWNRSCMMGRHKFDIFVKMI